MNIKTEKYLHRFWLFSLFLFLIISISSLSNHFTVHAFRQSQTALTAMFLKEDGFKLAYTTPFMGHPWTVPMEFPLYQWITYILSELTTLNLIKVGKTLNQFFHIANNFLILTISKKLFIPSIPIFTGLILYNLHPFYLTYDNTFLIDPFSLTLCLASILFLICYWKINQSYIFVTLAFVFSILTSLIKITTFIGILTPLILFSIISLHPELLRLNHSWRTHKRKITLSLMLWIVSFTLALLWANYADVTKGQNVISQGWQTINLHSWIFGTIFQRISFNNWYHYFTFSLTIHPGIFILTSLAIVYSLFHASIKNNALMVGYLFLYLFPPLIFTNLFFVHTYYSIITILFSCLFLGQLFFNISLVKADFRNYRFYILLISSISFLFYRGIVFKDQVFKNNPESGVFGLLHTVNFQPSTKDVILVIEPSQNPYLEYYFRCRGVNLSFDKFIEIDKLRKIQDLFRGEKLRLICIADNSKIIELPEIYRKYLKFYNKSQQLFDINSSMYYNFFWY